MDRTIFDELKDIQRLIDEKRKLIYMLGDTVGDLSGKELERVERLIHDHEITIKALELYFDVLEKTIQAQVRKAT